jgi:hypothetical protein
MVVDPKKLKTMPDTEIKWFIDIGEKGLKNSWKGHKLEAQIKKALADLKAELKRRKAN